MEFTITGEILEANQNFIDLLGYTDLEELKGNQRADYMDNEYRYSENYTHFLEKLKVGEVQQGKFSIHNKDNTIFVIQAIYTPIQNEDGEVVKIIEVANNITDLEKQITDSETLRKTVDASFARVEFDSNGNILYINNNLKQALGYEEEDVLIGQNHSLFVEQNYRNSTAYKEFWEGLRANTTHKGEFERIGKMGNSVWIQAAYTPVIDENGKVVKIIKVATDITQQKIANDLIREQNAAIMEMAAPISQLSDQVSFIPLVGFMDSNRAARIMQLILESIGEKQTKVFILDIGGVAAMDTSIANHLLQIVRASKLMGCACIISGISSAVAQTIVELGIDTRDILTTNDMRTAIQKSIQLVGRKSSLF